ncbi:MAG: tryptophan--tRNA ligase [Actinomycetota bacterium]|nr:tryptophan--tRNA ligase [Actinomycetota bacterium]
MTRVLSGIQPSGDLHLGNYLGAIRRWAEQQGRQDAYYMLADLHAITVPYDPQELRARTLEVATVLVAAGLDPGRVTLFVQSHVHEHTELAWILTCLATMGELGRMVQFKEKSGHERESASAGLFVYPVLQAADILLYQADEVPVGEDQRQHVELTRDLAQRFNHRFGKVFTVPKVTTPKAGARIMDLQLVDKKMSKSLDSPRGIIYLLDSPAAIGKKIRAAVTDSGSEVRAGPDKPGITNLLELFCAVTGDDIPTLERRFDGRGYGEFKSELADAVVAFLRPLQERYEELAAAPQIALGHLAHGAEKAGAAASATLAAVKEAVGLLAPSATAVRRPAPEVEGSPDTTSPAW